MKTNYLLWTANTGALVLSCVISIRLEPIDSIEQLYSVLVMS